MYKLKVKLSSLLVFFMVVSLMSIDISVSKVSADSIDPQDVSQIVYFPDPVVNAIIHERSFVDVNDNVYKVDLQNITTIIFDGVNITSFDGLQFIPNLTSLEIDHSTVTDTTYLNNLNLQSFISYYTDYTNLIFLKTMPNLNAISINHTNNIDIDSISQLTTLKRVVLEGNLIPNINFVTNLNFLEIIDISFNPISSISNLSGNTTINNLIMQNTNVTDYSPISSMLNLVGINVINNNATQLPDLSSLTHLRNLSITNNTIDFSFGQNLMNLNYLETHGVNVSYTPPAVSHPIPTSNSNPTNSLPLALIVNTTSEDTISPVDLAIMNPQGIIDYTTITEVKNGTAEVYIDENTFNQAINLLQRKAEESRVVNINVNQGEADNISVTIPSSSIINANLNASGTIINVTTNNVSYKLPLILLKVTNKETTVNIQINSVDDSVKNSINNALGQKNATSINKVYDFIITVNENGEEKEINNFGNTYVTRTLKLDNNLENYLAYVYDPITQEISFTPSTITTVGEITYLEIKRNGNSIYGVAETSHHEFSDTLKHWAKDDINYLFSKTIISGSFNNNFSPDSKITRAELTKLIVKSLGLNKNQGDKKVFTDVNKSSWSSNYIDIASSYGLINGYSDGSFKPNHTLTREELSVVYSNVLRFLNKSINASNLNYSSTDKFKDFEELNDWAKIPTLQLKQLKILNGNMQSYFEPKKETSRAEVVVSLKRLLEYLKFIN